MTAASEVGSTALGDQIITGAGNDTIIAGGGANYINVGNGNNTVAWTEGVSVAILAGSGTETFDMSSAAQGHVIYAAAGTIVGSDVYFNGFERIIATDFGDEIWGAPASVKAAPATIPCALAPPRP